MWEVNRGVYAHMHLHTLLRAVVTYHSLPPVSTSRDEPLSDLRRDAHGKKKNSRVIFPPSPARTHSCMLLVSDWEQAARYEPLHKTKARPRGEARGVPRLARSTNPNNSGMMIVSNSWSWPRGMVRRDRTNAPLAQLEASTCMQVSARPPSMSILKTARCCAERGPGTHDSGDGGDNQRGAR